MLTILNAIELSSDYLTKKKVESPRINAELLLAYILNCKRMDLYLKFDQPLSDKETIEYRKAIKRRGLREPLQYITGSVEFFGLEFMVDKNVLIPRPETELLVENVINFSKNKSGIRILDIGSGSGNIAISLAKNITDSQVTSIDKSENSINVAKHNAEIHGLNRKIKFLAIDINNYENNNKSKFDIIVSNPPYISLQEYSTLDEELINHEPKEALTDNSDGYSFYNIISARSKDLLINNGKLFFEIGHSQAFKIKRIMEENLFTKIQIIKDYSNIDRVIFGELK